jgi:hypothetical protein
MLLFKPANLFLEKVMFIDPSPSLRLPARGYPVKTIIKPPNPAKGGRRSDCGLVHNQVTSVSCLLILRTSVEPRGSDVGAGGRQFRCQEQASDMIQLSAERIVLSLTFFCYFEDAEERDVENLE